MIRCAWKGVFSELVTPFHDDERVDLRSLEALAEFAVESGAGGVIVNSKLAEADKLSTDERRRSAEAVLHKVRSRVPVLVDVSTPSNFTSIELARHAKDHGATGIMAAPALGSTFTESHVQIFFDELDAAVEMPTMVLDVLSLSRVTLSPHLIANLFPEIASVVAVKIEAQPTASKINAIARLEPGLAIFTGNNGAHGVDELERGARGITCSAALAVPAQQMLGAFSSGDLEGARRAQSNFSEVIAFVMQSPEFAPHCSKRLLQKIGVIDSAVVRRPTCPFDERNGRELLRVAADSGMLPKSKE